MHCMANVEMKSKEDYTLRIWDFKWTEISPIFILVKAANPRIYTLIKTIVDLLVQTVVDAITNIERKRKNVFMKFV